MTSELFQLPQTFYDELDQIFQARVAQLTMGISPAGLVQSITAWQAHLAMSPGRVAELALFPWMQMPNLFEQIAAGPGATAPDSRFRSPLWQGWPWRLYPALFGFQREWMELATTGISGLAPAAERTVSFVGRQMLDAFSPSNFAATNPEIAKLTVSSGGSNLVAGLSNAAQDLAALIAQKGVAGVEKFRPGEAVAVTPGKVVYRNDLMELIQYTPQTAEVFAEPVLILPAWIMKYYILDLSPHNSLVNWLTARGHTVFIISWKNPGSEDRTKGMDAYVQEGALAAIDAVSSIIPDQKIHLAGYCLGGTLAMITAALLAHDKDERLKSLTLFAAQGDFTEAGELMLFVNPSEVAFLKSMMAEKGYLDTKQMSGAFQMLHSYDLFWSQMVHSYLMGERAPMFDLMAWNADATRMPATMHAEYLEKLFLNNDFAEGRFETLGRVVAPESITLPVFAVGTETDHVAPWHSVYKVHLMMPGEVEFVLTSGGHNAGIVNEPGHPHRSYRSAVRHKGAAYQSPDEWLGAAELHDGSWWLAWAQWLEHHGTAVKVPAPSQAGNAAYPALMDAPGTYVHQK